MLVPWRVLHLSDPSFAKLEGCFSAKGNPLIVDIPHCFQWMCDV